LDNPIFRLEGIVKTRAEEMEDFVGPLDLILHLLSKNKIEIQDIRISQLLDQYMAYLEERKRMDLDIASEFVAMAAHLMYIKTRMLLSIHDEEALSEMEQLIQSLEERRRSENYQKIKEVAALLRTRGETGRDLFVRMPERRQEDKSYRYTHEKKDLVTAMRAVLERGEENMPLPERMIERIVPREPYPVARKAAEIIKELLARGVTRFLALFRGNRSRSEIVATFIAVLELSRTKKILLTGAEQDCTITCCSGCNAEVESGAEEMLEYGN